MAAVFATNRVPPRRLGPGSKPWLLIVYSADRGMLVSGYQTYAAPPSNIPGDALWLN